MTLWILYSQHTIALNQIMLTVLIVILMRSGCSTRMEKANRTINRRLRFWWSQLPFLGHARQWITRLHHDIFLWLILIQLFLLFFICDLLRQICCVRWPLVSLSARIHWHTAHPILFKEIGAEIWFWCMVHGPKF